MATQDVVVRYRADVEELTRQLNVIVDKQQDIVKQEKDANATLEKGVTSQQQAAKKRLELLKLEEAELKKLKELRKTAFDPKTIRDYDARIAQATANIKTLGGKVKGELVGVGSSIKSLGLEIAAGIGIAFSTQAVIEFGKASVNAFIEAEENANRLKFAITQVGGESEAVFDRLIKQSSELQSISIFSDDDIQKAQAALANFGLIGSQIEKLIPSIVDLASANKIDLAQATETVIRAFEGQTKGLTLLGLKFDDTGTRIGNYNKFMENAAKFTGATAEQAETLSGQLAKLDNQADELRESIGSRLAGSFVRFRVAALSAIKDVVDGLLGVEKQTQKQRESDVVNRVQADLTARATKLSSSLITEALKAQDKAQEEVKDSREELIKAEIKGQQIAITAAIQRSTRAAEELNAINQIIIAERQRLSDLGDILTAEQLRKKSITELNDLLNKYKDDSRAFAKDNIDLLNREIEARTKTAAKLKEIRDKEAADRIAANQKEFDDLSKQNDQFLDQLSKDIDKAKERAAADKQSVFEFKAKFTLDTQGQDAALSFIRDELRKTFELEIEAIDATADEAEVKAAKKQQAYDKYTTAAIEMLRKLGIFEGETYDDSVAKAEEAARKKQEANQALLDNSISIVNSLVGVFNNLYESQITDINRTRDAQLEALDVQQKAIDDQLEKRRISEEQAQNQTAKLAEKRVETEKRAADKERQIKKKQAELNKANALVQIAISTAQGVARAYADLPYYLAVPVSVLVAAAGVAQGALVASEPIPYEKGSKDTGSKGHIARVGEKGEEIVYMPSHSKVLPAKQTKTYGEALDAMYDNRFEKFVMKKYVTPALIKQKQTYEDNRQETLVKNISQSYMMQYTGLTASEMDAIRRKGQPISNADQIGAAVAEAMSKVIQTADPYRR